SGGVESIAQSSCDRLPNQTATSDATRLRRGKFNTDSGAAFSRKQGEGTGCNQGPLKIGSGGSRSQHSGRLSRKGRSHSDQRGAGRRFIHRGGMEALVDECQKSDESQRVLFDTNEKIGTDRLAQRTGFARRRAADILQPNATTERAGRGSRPDY